MGVLNHLHAHESVRHGLASAQATINAVHRRPVNLRRFAVTSSEATLRGAKTAATMHPWLDVEQAMSAYAVLAPGHVADNLRVFARAPLTLIAGVDSALGGKGKPLSGSAELQLLARVICTTSDDPLLPAVVHGDIAAKQYFGQRSDIIAWVAGRMCAQLTGLDPRGLCVPELYANRHRDEYTRLISSFTSPDGVAPFVAFYLQAFLHGANEAESIAALASQK